MPHPVTNPNTLIMQEEKFKVRAYGYGELALLYFPNSSKVNATTQFSRWIRQNENLKMKLFELGYKPKKKSSLPARSS